jgi:tRNA G18 (ribose-2'-O)-methylase SpoU
VGTEATGLTQEVMLRPKHYNPMQGEIDMNVSVAAAILILKLKDNEGFLISEIKKKKTQFKKTRI